MEGVSQGFPRDAVDFVAEDRFEASRLPFDEHAEGPRNSAIFSHGKFLAQGAQGLYQVVVDEGRRTQVLHGSTALSDYLIPAIESTLERLNCLSWPSGKEVANGLKAKHQALKTLQ